LHLVTEDIFAERKADDKGGWKVVEKSRLWQ